MTKLPPLLGPLLAAFVVACGGGTTAEAPGSSHALAIAAEPTPEPTTAARCAGRDAGHGAILEARGERWKGLPEPEHAADVTALVGPEVAANDRYETTLTLSFVMFPDHGEHFAKGRTLNEHSEVLGFVLTSDAPRPDAFARVGATERVELRTRRRPSWICYEDGTVEGDVANADEVLPASFTVKARTADRLVGIIEVDPGDGPRAWTIDARVAPPPGTNPPEVCCLQLDAPRFETTE